MQLMFLIKQLVSGASRWLGEGIPLHHPKYEIVSLVVLFPNSSP